MNQWEQVKARNWGLCTGAALAVLLTLAPPAFAARNATVETAPAVNSAASHNGPLLVYVYKNGEGAAVITQKQLPSNPRNVYVFSTPQRPVVVETPSPAAVYGSAYTSIHGGTPPPTSIATGSSNISVRAPAPVGPGMAPGGVKAVVLSSIDWYSRHYGVDPALVMAVAEAESNFDPNSVSHKGAQGVMQIMPETGQELGLANPFDPVSNVEAGVRYLRQLIDRYGHLELAIAAYNAGPGNVDRHAGIPPFAETRSYVQKVVSRYRALQAR